MPETAIIDSSVILAFLRSEPGAVPLDDMQSSFISAVNLAEVVAKLAEIGWGSDRIHSALDRFDLRVIPLDDDRAYRAGLLRPLTRDQGLSLGDRACLALAQEYGLPAVTADRKWSEVTIDVDIRQIR